MIHFFIGTKAQFIKTAPLMMEMNRRGIPFHLIETGQHGAITADLAGEFGIRSADTKLWPRSTAVTTLGQAAVWASGMLLRLLSSGKKISQTVFRGEKKGVCIIHGDTLSTLFSLFYALRCGIPVAHVEAGLRSYHVFDPFPEELVRLIAMRYSTILFAPSDWAMDNLNRMGHGAKALHSGGNTVVDAIRFARDRYTGKDRPDNPYVVMTIHRIETLYSSRRMNAVVTIAEEIARQRRVLFILHEPTRRRLERLNLMSRLHRCGGVTTIPLQPYMKFLDLLAGAEFAVTDGGSVQEECYSLDIPCLIMRAKTERMEGLGENAMLAGFSGKGLEEFLKVLPGLKRREGERAKSSPSSFIVEYLQKYTGENG